MVCEVDAIRPQEFVSVSLQGQLEDEQSENVEEVIEVRSFLQGEIQEKVQEEDKNEDAKVYTVEVLQEIITFINFNLAA